ncbi:MAG: hypothetical protein ACLU4Q_04310 [Streptococcus thermophilus]
MVEMEVFLAASLVITIDLVTPAMTFLSVTCPKFSEVHASFSPAFARCEPLLAVPTLKA